MLKRASGCLAHITSLPSQYGVGDFGPGAFQFVDWLVEAKQTYWQILPLTPTDGVFDHSPYSTFSAFGLNTLLLSPDLLIEAGYVLEEDVNSLFKTQESNFDTIKWHKGELLHLAYDRMSAQVRIQFQEFCEDHHFWLEDFALFVLLKDEFKGAIWNAWPEEFRRREQKALVQFKKERQTRFDEICFTQFIMDQQWRALHDHCFRRGIEVIGDMPIYVNEDSVDVWAHQSLFKLDDQGQAEVVAGVPPDYFSETGQRWGNPIYDWSAMKKDNFHWWQERFARHQDLYDLVRLDHFGGYVQCWEIPAHEETAINGHYVDVPGHELFKSWQERHHLLPVIAENLGTVTPEMTAVQEEFQFPGMKVLLFGFGGDYRQNPYIPENYETNCVVYTGTHDNNTIKGWFENEASGQERLNVEDYFNCQMNGDELPHMLIEAGLASKASVMMIPIADLLSLGVEGRFNFPGKAKGNWRWRFTLEQLKDVGEWLAKMSIATNRV